MGLKTFRDSIHGDIIVGQMQLAVIDSDAFQRLRYIKQNGLLHMVFPGAIHTRFVHSIGTMHIAQRVFSKLFPGYRVATDLGDSGVHEALRYVGTVFELAALMHDIGHCAFSHSIETVDAPGSSFRVFPEVDALVARWSDDYCPELALWWHKHRPAAVASISNTSSQWIQFPKHEEIGLFLAFMALKCPSLVETKHEKSRAEMIFGTVFPDEVRLSDSAFLDFVSDVLSLMRDEVTWLPPSQTFLNKLKVATRFVARPPVEPTSAHGEQLFAALHSLLSGTLDVDRMDYLLRDSKYAGTVIGTYDLDLIINSLSLGHNPPDDRIYLCISDRARGAIDDFLWSRWQLYLQIINHKANVMLNALFPDAFRSVTKQPTDLDDYSEMLLFTDDNVMTAVRRLFLTSMKASKPSLLPAKLAFLRTRLPRHLYVLELEEVEVPANEALAIAEQKRLLARSMGVEESDIRVEKTSTDLIKHDSALPRVVRKVLSPIGSPEYELCEPDYLSERWRSAGRPTRVRRAHFFTTRDLNPAHTSATLTVLPGGAQHPPSIPATSPELKVPSAALKLKGKK